LGRLQSKYEEPDSEEEVGDGADVVSIGRNRLDEEEPSCSSGNSVGESGGEDCSGNVEALAVSGRSSSAGEDEYKNELLEFA
jgi:hypothetical protein